MRKIQRRKEEWRMEKEEKIKGKQKDIRKKCKRSKVGCWSESRNER